MFKNIYKNDDMKRGEHMAVRTTVGWYLWTHQIIEITGGDVTEFLDHFFSGNIASLKVGRDRYTTMLNDEGEIIDDVVIFRMEEDRYWISTLFASKMDDWFFDRQGDYDVDWTEITDDWHMFAVQGPRSKEVLNELVDGGVEDLKFFAHADGKIGDISVMINRSGYTGEKWGYEIYCAADDADAIEDKIAAACEKAGGRQVTEFQVMAWTLPTEAGFYYMKDLAHKNPFEVGLENGICWDKEFVGKKALLKVKENGAENEMVGFVCLEDDHHIQGAHLGGVGDGICVDGECIGRVTKIVYSYVKDENIGYIFARKGTLHEGDHITVHGSECVITGKKWL